jgi:MFS family permease
MGLVFSAFSWTYTASQIPAGMFLDRVGVRKTYFLAVASWSTFIVLHGFVGGLASLLVCRFGLGVAESPCGAGGTARFSTGVYFRRGARRLRIDRPRIAPSRCGLAGEWSPANQLAGRDGCRL